MEQYFFNRNILHWHWYLLFSLKIKLCYWIFLLKVVMIIDIYWKQKKSFTYHFIVRNKLAIGTRVCLKGIFRWRKFDNIVTMTCRIISISRNIITFHDYQIHVHHITIKYSLINFFVILLIFSIIEKFIIIQLLWRPIILEYLQ